MKKEEIKSMLESRLEDSYLTGDETVTFTTNQGLSIIVCDERVFCET